MSNRKRQIRVNRYHYQPQGRPQPPPPRPRPVSQPEPEPAPVRRDTFGWLMLRAFLNTAHLFGVLYLAHWILHHLHIAWHH